MSGGGTNVLVRANILVGTNVRGETNVLVRANVLCHHCKVSKVFKCTM